MWNNVILLKLGFTLVASLILLCGRGFLIKCSQLKHSTLIFFIFLRIVPYILIYIIAGIEPRGDIPFFFYKAQHAQNFELVYRDFWSYHSPLFSYVLGILMFIWKSPEFIVLFFLFGEFITLKLTEGLANPNSKLNSIMYLLLPAPFIIMLFGGQEDIILWSIVLVAYFTYQKYQNTSLFGLTMALNLVFMKITAIVFFLPVFIYLKKRWGFALGATTLCTLVFGITYLLVGNEMFMFLEHTDNTFSPNLYTITKPLTANLLENEGLLYLNIAVLFIISILLILASIELNTLALKDFLTIFWVITYGLMTALLPASMIYYVYTFLLIVVFFTIDLNNKGNLVLFLFFNFAVVLQPYLFIKLGQPLHKDFSFVSNSYLLFEYLLEVFLVVYVLKLALDAYLQGIKLIDSNRNV